MPEALNVAIDPHLIALPDPCNSVKDLELFVENLLAWAKALDQEDIKILLAQSCLEAMYADGFYPYDDYKLRTLLNTYTIDDEPIADEDTVALVLRRLLDQTPLLEEFIGISVILYDEEKTTISPDNFLKRLGSKTAQALRESLIMLMLWHQNFSLTSPIQGCVFATGRSEILEHQNTLSVFSEVIDISCDENSIISYKLPHVVNGSFHICVSDEDLLKNVLCYAVLDLWNPQDEQLPCYITTAGKNLLAEWLNSLVDLQAQKIIQARLSQVKRGTLGDHKSVGEGVYELRIRYGPAYRVYFSYVTTTQILLLCGGDKSTQPEDIIRAKQYWKAYKQQ